MNSGPATNEGATLLLKTPRPWFGNPQLGAFVVSVDGRRRGVLMPQGSLALGCPAGHHRVRARQWWYLSPQFDVNLAPGETVELKVDLVRTGSFGKRFLGLMFVPWRGVQIASTS